MSTRCNIILNGYARDKKIYLYHHHDGYPSGVGADLAEFLKQRGCKKDGRWDEELIATALVKKQDDEYECSAGLHGDIEYLYVIDAPYGKLRCYEVDWKVVGWDKPMNEELICQQKYQLPIPGWDDEKEAEDGR